MRWKEGANIFARLGLQKRIMLYVAAGLVLIFGVFFYLGTQAVQQSTSLVFEERLATAESVAAVMASDFAHVLMDVPERGSKSVPHTDRAAWETAAQEILYHLVEVHFFAFFKVTSVWLLDNRGQLLAAAPRESSEEAQQLLPVLFAKGTAAWPQAPAFWPESGPPGSFASLRVPLRDAQGNPWAWVLVNTEGFNTTQPFAPFALPTLAPKDWLVHAPRPLGYAEYHLEVMAPSGIVILGIGSDEPVGRQSPHFPLLQPQMQARGGKVMLHEVKEGPGRDHVMAAVPVPLSDLYLVLEQSQDVALALPNTLRNGLLIFSGIGFSLTLLVAWLTTRQVVKPTEVLTAAAVRMAQGELATPIRVWAQDEIGVLAENLESMRQQLQKALAKVEAANLELESRVEERTSQLRELVRRVFDAQEEERHRIALELHDETAQALTALSVTLDSLLRHPRTSEDTIMLREARQLATDTMEDLRRLIYALRPVALQEMRLAAALRSYAEDLLERSGVAVHVKVEGQEAELPQEVELALYRIGQEALNNVLRHAGARDAWVTLAYDASFLRLTVRDNGVGFDAKGATEGGLRSRGLGLAGMRERASLLGGRLTLDAAPGRGTLVEAEVPLPRHG